MRTVATPGATFGSLVREWLRIGHKLCARWLCASRANASRAETSAPLPDLIEALAPLGMPDVHHASRRPRRRLGDASTRCNVTAPEAWRRSPG